MPGIKGTMHEFKKGTLHSGSKTGPKVKSRAQAIAIGLNEEGRSSTQSRIKRKGKKKKKSDNSYYNTMKSAGMLD